MSRTGTSSWKQARRRQLNKEPMCECGRLADEVDHIVPVMDGGSDDPSNLRSVCHLHHVKKTRGEQRRAAARRADRALRVQETHPADLL